MPAGVRRRVPEVDPATCVLCLGCVDLCPDVFAFHPAGYIAVSDTAGYPDACVDEAIRDCPKKSIAWR